MHSTSRPGWRSLTVLTVAASLTAGAAVADSGKVKAVNNAYIVQLVDAPVVAYQGGIKGLQATKPRKGQKIDPNAPAVVNYMGYLASKQDAVLAGVGARKKLYNYGYAFNGFAAELTEAQVRKLARMPGVVAVTPNEILKRDTSSTPNFLGLSGANGFWNTQAKGEGVVIGIVDSGIWPQHPSFSDRTGSNGNFKKDGKLGYQQLPGWNGKCTPGEAFNASDCNQKLIGARYYNAGYGGNEAIKQQFPYEFNSPRDADGHGSHTASTAGGNAGVPAVGDAALLGNINGIAPRARIAAYKVCWGNNGEGGCSTVDSVAAIDQAVADGVDVINFSISGTTSNFRSAVEIAFLFAADAGVFVAASAGNDGPSTSTVAHPSPWITTVAAGTHDRNGAGRVTTGGGATYLGASFATALPSKPLVDAAAIVAAGANPTEAELCYPGTLDSASAAGKIVLCKRGVIALVDKSRAVAEAGGAGMVLYNDPAGGTNLLALFHSVPAVHLTAANGLAVKAYIAAQGPAATASIAQSTVTYDLPAPLTASFSSRGPLVGASGNLLKPDIIAPGQDILAAVSPVGYNGKTFDLLSGTSMSSPHIAGMAALMKELRPNWTPMMIKSALMTTAGDVLDGPNTNPLVIFRQGAGHVRINAAANPGLVFDSGWNDWLSFLCGVQPGGGCTGVTPMHPSELNVPSIAFGALPGSQTVKRRVTNVSGNPATFTSRVSGLAGFTVTVDPPALALAAGETKEVSVTLARTTAPLNSYTGGQLSWSDGSGTMVRIPVVARPVALAAPTQVSGSYDVTFGYTGAFTAMPRGLVPSKVTAGTVAQDPDQTFDPNDTVGNVLVEVQVPAGTTYARFSLFDADVAAGSDVDLYVFGPTGAFVAGSGNGGSDEEVNVVNPAAGTYYVFMHGWGLPSASSPFKLHAWTLGATAAGNMTVSAPATAVTGQTGRIQIVTNGLTAGTKYLGSVAYDGAAGMPPPTIVRIDTP